MRSWDENPRTFANGGREKAQRRGKCPKGEDTQKKKVGQENTLGNKRTEQGDLMKIFIVGATGRVGSKLTEFLVDVGHTVYAGARSVDSISPTDQVHPVKFDMHGGVADMKPLFEGMDAIYFVAGSRGRDLLQTDAYGTVKTMQAAEEAGVQRYVMLSSMFADEPEKWHEYPSLESIMDYNIAKFFADQWLIFRTHLTYTILQPGTLQELPGTGLIALDDQAGTENTIEDVAHTLADIIAVPQTEDQVIRMSNGNTPVLQALESLPKTV